MQQTVGKWSNLLGKYSKLLGEMKHFWGEMKKRWWGNKAKCAAPSLPFPLISNGEHLSVDMILEQSLSGLPLVCMRQSGCLLSWGDIKSVNTDQQITFWPLLISVRLLTTLLAPSNFLTTLLRHAILLKSLLFYKIYKDCHNIFNIYGTFSLQIYVFFCGILSWWTFVNALFNIPSEKSAT